MSETRRQHQAAKTTIVGGQPPGNDRELLTVPVGLEELLAMAAVDDAFAEALLNDPEAAVAASGVELTATEQAILRAMDGASLVPMIAQVRPTLPEPERRAFLEQASAAMVALVAGGAALGSAGCKSGGSGSAQKKKPKGRKPKGRKPTPREAVDTGARPDRPPEKADAGVKTMGRPRPAHPKHYNTTTGINPNRRLVPPKPDDQ